MASEELPGMPTASALAPTVGVCGFGRCGSSMVMSMLFAGGLLPADGADERSGELDLTAAADLPARRLAGRAVKLLDSILYPPVTPLPPAQRWLFIWMDRDHQEQARSQVKFLRAAVGLRLTASAADDFERSYRRDKPRAVDALRELGPVHEDTYERALAYPFRFAADLARFLRPHFALDVEAAAAAVHRRSPQCARGLDYELTGAAP